MMRAVSLLRKLNYMILYTIFILSACIISGCENEDIGTTYITGKIINPNVPYVILTNSEGVNDTIALNEYDQFIASYDSFTTGFIKFAHPTEYQTIFIAQGDSISLRINTKAFDESLAFNGDRAKENNYLVDQFIKIEQQNRDLLSNYKVEPIRFIEIIDSIERDRMNNLEINAKKMKFHQDFVAKTKFTFKISSASRLEQYPITHYGRNKLLDANELPSSFYAHRKNIDLNEKELLNDFSFRTYASALISNIALNNIATKYGTEFIQDRNSLDYRKEKLHIIDSLFTDPAAKEIFAGSEIRNFIRTRKNSTEISALLEEFFKISKNARLNQKVRELATNYKELDPGNKIYNFTLVGRNDTVVQLRDRTKKLSVLYFWSQENADYAVRVHKKVRELRVKYPNIYFIGINTDMVSSSNFKKLNSRYMFDPHYEFQLKNQNEILPHLEMGENRTMLIEKDLTILDPSINLFHYKIETTLLGYLNR
jgi:peroxiredoxin